jgi:hypothetical protein
MAINYKYELKVWPVYFVMIIVSCYIHEIGHCIPAWVHGYFAVPTPAKEYVSSNIPVGLKPYISLGGIIGSVLVPLMVILLYITKPYKHGSALLAGAMAMPGMYTLRFILSGRGHDATEFQEAQSALGLSYSGHSLDWIFLILFLSGIAVWIIKSKPNYKIAGRLSIGFVLTFIFVIGLQVTNNAIFDPVFRVR